MTLYQAFVILRWHAQHSTKGHLAYSVTQDQDFETAYRKIFGAAPRYADLMKKINECITK